MTDDRPAPLALARDLIAAGGIASLATLTADGGPFASYVTIAAAPDDAPVTLLSRLAIHTQNLARDPRASLLLVREPAEGEAMTAARLTLTGHCVVDTDEDARTAFLTRHPDAHRYANFPDFALYRFAIQTGHLVAGFGIIVSFNGDELRGALR